MKEVIDFVDESEKSWCPIHDSSIKGLLKIITLESFAQCRLFHLFSSAPSRLMAILYGDNLFKVVC